MRERIGSALLGGISFIGFILTLLALGTIICHALPAILDGTKGTPFILRCSELLILLSFPAWHFLALPKSMNVLSWITGAGWTLASLCAGSKMGTERSGMLALLIGMALIAAVQKIRES